MDFTTAVKKVLNIRLSYYRHILPVFDAGLWFCNPRDYFPNRHFLVLETVIRPHGCFGFLQFPVTPPFLRICRAESTRHAAMFTVMDRKRGLGLTRKFTVACEKRAFVFRELSEKEKNNKTKSTENLYLSKSSDTAV